MAYSYSGLVPMVTEVTATVPLREVGSFKFETVSPYSFEYTVHKPAGLCWSTPDEKFEKGTLWTATRFEGQLFGLKLHSAGNLKKTKIGCTVFSGKDTHDSDLKPLQLMLQ